MTGRFSWLGGRSTPKTDAQSLQRAADHQLRVARNSRDSKARQRRDQTNRPRWNE